MPLKRQIWWNSDTLYYNTDQTNRIAGQWFRGKAKSAAGVFPRERTKAPSWQHGQDSIEKSRRGFQQRDFLVGLR